MLHLFVALLHPTARLVEPHHLGNVGRQEFVFLGLPPARSREVVLRYQVVRSGKLAASVAATTNCFRFSGP